MKRSEMIESIKDDIYTYSNCPEDEIDSLAEILLKNIEDFGVLPPEIRHIRSEACKDVYTGEDIFFIKSSQLLNKWEPEEGDEKK